MEKDMKKLVLMRHAKSSWKYPELSDHQRPLNPRGKGDAPRMGAFLQRQGVEVDAIFCSTSQRTRETLALFLKEFTFEGETHFTEALYHAGLNEYLEVLAELPADVETAMLIGHNPTMAYALDYFCDEQEKFPTAAIAYIAFDIGSWSEIEDDIEGKLLGYWRPKGI